MNQATSTWWVSHFDSKLGFGSQNLNLPLPAMDANGYPIGLGNLASQSDCVYTTIFNGEGEHLPTGTYTLTFDGHGSVSIKDGPLGPEL